MRPRTNPLPSRRLQAVVTVVLVLGITGLDLSTPLSWPTAFLVVISGLKLLEARSLGERRIVALLQLTAAGLIGALLPGLLSSAGQLLITLGALAGLLQLELHRGLCWKQLLRQTARLLAASLPTALVLFLLVPRFGPIWSMNNLTAQTARTGLAAQLDPGSIARLVDNNAIAARVAFSDNRPPRQADPYWRVLVHEHFDGRSWLRGDEIPKAPWIPPQPFKSQTPGRRELWIIESQALEAVPWDGRAQPLSRDLRLHRNGELIQAAASPARRSYELLSQEQPAAWQSRPPSAQDLALPRGAQPQLEALGARWSERKDPKERILAAEAWFRGQDFRYSRTPGALPEQGGLDVFLFQRREGFCGHYASAFTALMRAAGIPARVVSGYRGGTWIQPLRGAPFLEIRQNQAHAWSEVWLSEAGWIQIDPSNWATGGNGIEHQLNQTVMGRWWLWSQRQWSGLELSWSRWWLGFDREGQAELLQRLLGEQRPWLGIMILAGVAVSLVIGMVLLQCLAAHAERKDSAARAIAQVLKVLATQGIEPRPGETLDMFTDRVSQQHAHLTTLLKTICEAHQTLRFGRGTNRDLQRLKRGCRSLTQTMRIDTV